jgi:uncharacterized protein (DUF2141 family)
MPDLMFASLFRLLAIRARPLLTPRALIVGSLIAGSLAATPAMADGPPPGCTGPASAHWINVVVEGVRNDSGQIAITLYADDSSKFLVKHGSLYVGRTKAVAGTTNTCIFLPKNGVWVLALYHDENSNEKFDLSSFKLPAEGYGFSNNPPTLLGLPTFNSVRINIARDGMSSHIRIKYP